MTLTNNLLLQRQVNFIDLRVCGGHDEDIIGYNQLLDCDIQVQLCSLNLEHVERGVGETSGEESLVIVVSVEACLWCAVTGKARRADIGV